MRERAENRIKRQPASGAWEAWEIENADLLNVNNLGGVREYLRNRLIHAFMDGYEAGSHLKTVAEYKHTEVGACILHGTWKRECGTGCPACNDGIRTIDAPERVL